jgi:hypothetical protein
MACSDSLQLQRYADGDLDALHTSAIADHLETCDVCRDELRRLADLRSYIQERLGAEDEGEEELTATAIAAMASRLPAQPAVRGAQPWWRRTWMATAAIIVIALLIPISYLSNLFASPDQILEEASVRGRMWMYQPHKTLQWEVDTVSEGIRGVDDGRWRTYFWRSNGATAFSETSRQINPKGRTEFASWTYADGSSVYYRSRNNTIEIAPSNDVVRQAMPSVSDDIRSVLQSQLTFRSLRQSLDVHRRRDLERLHGRSVWISGGDVTFSRGRLALWGDAFHIKVVKKNSSPGIVRAVHEYDIDSDSLRLLRLKTTLTYDDGTTGTHDSRWVSYREISPADYAAQKPDALLQSGLPVVHLTPLDISKRLQEGPAGR